MKNAVSRREIGSWALYDFAISAFNTLVLTFIFNNYFTFEVIGEEVRGGVLWTRAITISALIVAIVTPVLGAIADYSGVKKRFLVASALICALLTASLFFVRPGMVWLPLVILILANIAFEAGNAFYNAFLPELATKRTIGRISGLGQGLGYFGGLICLALALGMVRLWLPEDGQLNVRATNLLAAGWILVFTLPTFLFLRDRTPRRRASTATYVRQGFARIRDSARHLRSYREAAKLLLARLVYNDGLATIFATASIYLGAVYDLSLAEILPIAIGLNVAAGVGALALGFVNDKLGGKKTIGLTLIVLIVATGYGLWAPTVGHFWVAATLLGLMVGPNQAASRSFLGLLIPEHKHAEMFGFYTFSGRLASVFGPLTFGTVLAATGNYRWAMGSVIAFFALGLLLLGLVREEEGLRLADRLSREASATPAD